MRYRGSDANSHRCWDATLSLTSKTRICSRNIYRIARHTCKELGRKRRRGRRRALCNTVWPKHRLTVVLAVGFVAAPGIRLNGFANNACRAILISAWNDDGTDRRFSNCLLWAGERYAYVEPILTLCLRRTWRASIPPDLAGNGGRARRAASNSTYRAFPASFRCGCRRCRSCRSNSPAFG